MNIRMTQMVTYSKDKGQNCTQKEKICIPQIEQTNKQQTNLFIIRL